MMKNTSKLVMIAALILIAVIAGPALAADACIVPPDEYFTTDGYGASPAPVHGGIQLGYVWWIPAYNDEHSLFTGNHYLGLTHHTYKLKDSHNEQEQIAFGKMFYCASIADYPYIPEVTFTSEDPTKSVYEPARASGIFR